MSLISAKPLFTDLQIKAQLVGFYKDSNRSMALADKVNPDPDLRSFSEPVNKQHREDLLVKLAASVTVIYRYFEPHRNFNNREILLSDTIRRA